MLLVISFFCVASSKIPVTPHFNSTTLCFKGLLHSPLKFLKIAVFHDNS